MRVGVHGSVIGSEETFPMRRMYTPPEILPAFLEWGFFLERHHGGDGEASFPARSGGGRNTATSPQAKIGSSEK